MKTISFLGINTMLCVIVSFVFYACVPQKAAYFKVDYATESDTIRVECWETGRLMGDYTSKPYITSTGKDYAVIGIYSYRDSPQMFSEENAFHFLCVRYDSVRFTRLSDNAATITYRHDENATEAQRYFFTREAWTRDPEGKNVWTYHFHLTDDMFQVQYDSKSEP